MFGCYLSKHLQCCCSSSPLQGESASDLFQVSSHAPRAHLQIAFRAYSYIKHRNVPVVRSFGKLKFNCIFSNCKVRWSASQQLQIDSISLPIRRDTQSSFLNTLGKGIMEIRIYWVIFYVINFRAPKNA